MPSPEAARCGGHDVHPDGRALMIPIDVIIGLSIVDLLWWLRK